MEELTPANDASCRENIQWLIRLRSLVIFGISLVVFISINGLDIPLRQAPLWGTLCIFGAFNWLTSLRLHTDMPATEFEVLLQLGGDVLCISALLYFTGGATNPIAWFFLLPLVIASTVLPQSLTWNLVFFALLCYTMLIGYYEPLPQFQPSLHPEHLPPKVQAMMETHHLELHTFGMWFGFVFSAILVAYFVADMANSLRERDRKLAQAREQALRDERVVSLGTLAAGAAHEMGTPLGTMAILLKELEHDYAQTENVELLSRFGILREQVDRCKDALSVMSASAGQLRAESGRKMPVDRYLGEMLSQWRSQQPSAPLDLRLEGEDPVPSIIAERTLTHAFINILNNAADVSPRHIGFYAHWNAHGVTVEISDHGPGISPDLFETLGRRPVTTKDYGLGVGLFLAHATIERMGGKIEIAEVPHGACVRIQLPLLPPM